MARRMQVGIISDTHGLMRPEALSALAGSDYIVHAGDIGAPEILDALREIAPVTAVRGNNDTASWARDIPETDVLRTGGISVYVLHDVNSLAMDPATEGHRVVVAGHSHRPLVVTRNEVLFVNPGSAGPRRFSLPVAIAYLHIEHARVHASIVSLQVVQRASSYSKM